MKQILKDPNPLLHKRSSPVTNFSEARKIAQELIETTKTVDRFWKPWLGMAAPQIGYNKRLILLKQSLKDYKILVNPEILKEDWKFYTKSTCYSLNGLYLYKSSYKVKARYQDLEGIKHEEEFVGGKAIALKHEVDHLNGVLLTDYATRLI